MLTYLPIWTATIYTMSDVPEISVDQLDELFASGVLLIDVREDDEYTEGHVPGAHHIPLADLVERIDEIDNAQTVYCICAMGGRSAKAVGFLRSNGFDAINVAGGTQGWVASGRGVVQGTDPA